MYDPETKTYVLLLEQGSMTIEEKQEGKGVTIRGSGSVADSLDRADIRDLIGFLLGFLERTKMNRIDSKTFKEIEDLFKEAVYQSAIDRAEPKTLALNSVGVLCAKLVAAEYDGGSICVGFETLVEETRFWAERRSDQKQVWRVRIKHTK